MGTEVGKAVFRAMTPLEVRAARALGGASFAPGTSAKRIALKIASQVGPVASTTIGLPGNVAEWAGRITEKQAAILWKLCWSYRKSITDEEVLDAAAHDADRARLGTRPRSAR